MTISANIEEIRKELPPSTRLVAVSKFKPAEDIMEAYNSGLREFGENRPQEMQMKAQSLPSDIKSQPTISRGMTEHLKRISRVHVIS